MKRFIKYIFFFLTPHLFFDRVRYFFAKENKLLADSIQNENNVFVFLACDYANLGDYAISLAQKRMLEKIFPKHNVILIEMNHTYSALKAIVNTNQTDDIVTLIGGGNMGDMYYGYERKRNLLISKLPGFRIISFPQTVSFSESFFGTLCLKRTRKTYSRHPNLTLMARERKSYDLMLQYFPQNRVVFTPDVVLTYEIPPKDVNRKGIVLTLRNDEESFMSKDDKEKLILKFQKCDEASFHDTCPTSCDNLEKEFEKLIEKYSRSKLVITDRLHGMIFSYITKTPTLVFDNSNAKISQCYEWIRGCGFIKLVNKDDISNLDYLMKEVMSSKPTDLNMEYFGKIIADACL
ncbi:MAG: polysaccharide pyruvyl transferase family protein [Fibrobacteraceae bacterium]|nr:polysaccharide pyruvyl transferase family protein [Fibrobacteraceae bacterium]